MQPGTNRLQELFDKWLAKTANSSETDELMILLNTHDLFSLAPALKKAWDEQEIRNTLPASQKDLIVDTILNGHPAEKENWLPVVHRAAILRTIWVRYAAAALILVASGVYFWLKNNPSSGAGVAVNDPQQMIVPGTNKAILTLADGSSIALDSAQNGSLAQQGGTQVIKLTSGQLAYRETATAENNKEISYNTITTPRGGQYQIVLPDGSRVWLNADSYIRFPTVFNAARRNVEIKGEVYMEIAKHASQPFLVTVRDVQIDVLGTGFNIMAYEEEPSIQTTLVEGSVKISVGGRAVTLTPGQQARSDNGKMAATTLDVEELEQVTAWKEGLFPMKGIDINTLIRQLSRWYDIEIEVEKKAVFPEIRFGGSVSRDVNLADMLAALKDYGIGSKQKNGKLLIYPVKGIQ